MVQAEAAEGEQSSERLRGQVVQGVMAKTQPFYVVQALGGEVRPVWAHISDIVELLSFDCNNKTWISTWKARFGI